MRQNSHKFRRITLLLALSQAALIAQGVTTSEVNGSVLDARGAPVVNAKVTLISPSLQGERTFATDDKGKFSARLLPPGSYTVRVVKDGFQTIRVPIKVQLAQSYTPRFTLQPEGNVVVEVVGTLSQLGMSNVSSTSNYHMEMMENLPTARTPEAMLTLTPGVIDQASAVSSTPTGYEAIRGAMSADNKFLVDGQNVNDTVYGNRSVELIDDAIQEVQIITGAISAEYGDVAGGVVNTVTKTGGNEFTGSLRWIFSDNGWDAYQPYQPRGSLLNKLLYSERMTVGGYLIKDKLWFFLSGYQNQQNQAESISAPSPEEGTPFNNGSTDKRMQLKLTYSVNQDHNLSFAYSTHRQDLTDRPFLSGDLASLIQQVDQDSLWSLNWAATWTSHLSMEARIGQKKEGLTAGGTLPGVTPIYDVPAGQFYDNGLFNFNDGGDHRDNNSADLKFVLAVEGGGNHEIAFGANYLKGTHRAQNQQSPTNGYIYVGDYTLPGYPPNTPAGGNVAVQTATDVYEWLQYASSTASAYMQSLGFYVNDQWAVNKNLNFNLGLRYDHYHAYSNDTGKEAGAYAWSPRLSAKYDPFGDARWQFAASFCKYNSTPLTNIVNSVSNSGNPSVAYLFYNGPTTEGGGVTQANLTNQANYYAGAYSAPLTTDLATNLHAPHVNEYQISAAHSFKINDREAYVKLTVVRRDFEDLFDYEVGNSGTVQPPASLTTPLGVVDLSALPPQYITQWVNSPYAKRLYKDIELETAYQGRTWDLQYNVTWSDLEGNYQGESNGYGPIGGNLQNYTVVNGVQMYDAGSTVAPYGKLIGDVPLRMRGAFDYHWDWTWGRTTLGVIYRFDSGQHQNMYRAIGDAGELNPAFDQNTQMISAIAGGGSGNFYQYYPGRGDVIFPSQAYTDLTIQQEFSSFRIGSKAARFFLKVSATNVFNHQQQIALYNQWNPTDGSPTTGAGTGLNTPWTLALAPGQSGQSQSLFGFGRQLSVEAGLKF